LYAERHSGVKGEWSEIPVSLPLALDVLHHQDHDGEGVEHQDKEDVEIGMAIVLVFLKCT
jgi:hypothetical protein